MQAETGGQDSGIFLVSLSGGESFQIAEHGQPLNAHQPCWSPDGSFLTVEFESPTAPPDLYRIDLSQVVSKYIGETEKNLRQTLAEAGVAVEHKQGLGNTGILEQALASGAVDIYPEYTGTIVRELLKREGKPALEELNTWLAPRGLKAAVPLGFNNTYALALRASDAERLGVTRISDLARLPAGTLKPGLSHEFQARADGWPALQRAYGLPFGPGAALDHGLAYDALAAGQVDLIDIYSTDAKVGRYQLRVLEDDRSFFPRYDAVLLMRAAVETLSVTRSRNWPSYDISMVLCLRAQTSARSVPTTCLRLLIRTSA